MLSIACIFLFTDILSIIFMIQINELSTDGMRKQDEFILFVPFNL